MDADHFDALSRALGRERTRRQLTRLLGGLSLAGVLTALGGEKAAAALRYGGSSCTNGSDCKTGKCLNTGKCSCSKVYPTCKQPANRCKQATCSATGRCVTSNKAQGSRCPDDGNPCTRDICNGNGVCTHPNKTDGVSCQWGGMVCTAGSCGCPELGNHCQQCTRCGPEGSCLPDPERQGKACQQTPGICCLSTCCPEACTQEGLCPGFG